MNNTLVELLAYLNTLAQVQSSGHYVNDEIKEVIKAIRVELGLDNLKETHKLLYKRQLGYDQLTFIENVLFEAVFGDSVDNEIEIPFEIVEAQRVERAVKVLEKLVKGKVSLQVSDFKVTVRK